MSDQLPDKIPPQSIEAEQSLLGSLMLDKDAIIKVVDFLQIRDFYKGIHQEIYFRPRRTRRCAFRLNEA